MRTHASACMRRHGISTAHPVQAVTAPTNTATDHPRPPHTCPDANAAASHHTHQFHTDRAGRMPVGGTDVVAEETNAPQPVHPGFEPKPFGHAWHSQAPGAGANQPELQRAHEFSPGCDLAKPGRHGLKAVPPLHPKLSQPALGTAARRYTGSLSSHLTEDSRPSMQLARVTLSIAERHMQTRAAGFDRPQQVRHMHEHKLLHGHRARDCTRSTHRSVRAGPPRGWCCTRSPPHRCSAA